MQSTPPPSNPPGSNYREIFAHLCGMLPPLPDDTPDTRAARHRRAMDAVAALNPADAFEARLAARIVAMDDHAADCLRRAGLAAADPDKMRRCRAQAASMARQSDAALRSLQRMQATREKQEAETASRRDGARRLLVPRYLGPAPAPDPAPPAEAAPFNQLTEADRYAVMYPDRAARIRAAGGLPATWTSARRSPNWSPTSSAAPARSCWRWIASGSTAPRNRHASPFPRQRLTQRHFETMVRASGTRTAQTPPASAALRSPASGTRCDRNTSAQARHEYRSACARHAARSARQRLQRRHPQIRVHRADPALRVGQHVVRPGHRKRRDRRAAGQRLQHHQPERIGQAGEHEHIRAGIGARQRLAIARPGEPHLRIVAPQPRQDAARRRPPPSIPADQDRGTRRCSSPPPPGRHRGTPAAAVPSPRAAPA